MSFREFAIKLVAWIGTPNKPDYLHEKFTVASQLRIARFQERESSVSHARIV